MLSAGPGQYAREERSIDDVSLPLRPEMHGVAGGGLFFPDHTDICQIPPAPLVEKLEPQHIDSSRYFSASGRGAEQAHQHVRDHNTLLAASYT